MVEYYLDENSSLQYSDVLSKNIPFQNAKEKLLSFGYSPGKTVWLRFSFTNSSDRPIRKTVEFDNPHIGKFVLYDIDANSSITMGYNHQKKDETTTTYPFEVELAPHETKRYIMQVTSPLTPLIVRLKVWDDKAYHAYQIKHQVALGFFFGGVVALLLYNLFLLFFIKDRVYFYYCAYLFGMILHTLYFTGFLNLYIVPGFYPHHRYVADIMIYLLIVFMPPFVRNYLRLQNKAPKIDRLLYHLPVVITIIAALKIFGLISTQLYVILYLLFAPLMIYIGVYAVILGVKEAYYFLAGWVLMIGGLFLMALYTTGKLPLFVNFPYLLEVGYFSEAIIFSIGLAAKINTLKEQKAAADAKLIEQQKEVQKRLEVEVSHRTEALKKTLDEKELLFKELHHRVKNNLQMVISLLRLQSDRVEDDVLKEVLFSAQNRISAMSNLHQLLYRQENISQLDTEEYFMQIVNEIRQNMSDKKDIRISMDITTTLGLDQAVYCGLIINELLSNAFKHAFDGEEGNIVLTLSRVENKIVLEVCDDGVGFDENTKSDTLGLLLVKTLTRNQLKGSVDIVSDRGTKVTIRFDA
ncbi:7TM diverse intracellular signaling domain-containing protein [Hydrogenimonas sp.]